MLLYNNVAELRHFLGAVNAQKDRPFMPFGSAA
jgi:hypothetical protein